MRHNKSILYIPLALSLCLLSVAGFSQTTQYLSAKDSDPQAVALLEKMQSVFREQPVSLRFTLTLQFPGEDAIVQEGEMQQQGSQYHIKTEDMEIWCDGESRWVHTEGAGEVNLYSAGEDDLFGVNSLVGEYASDKYIAGITGEEPGGSTTVNKIMELKPADRQSDIAKVRIVAKPNGEPVRMEIFEKSATRTTIAVHSLSRPKARDVSFFTFQPAQFPGVHVEDLRID